MTPGGSLKLRKGLDLLGDAASRYSWYRVSGPASTGKTVEEPIRGGPWYLPEVNDKNWIEA